MPKLTRIGNKFTVLSVWLGHARGGAVQYNSTTYEASNGHAVNKFLEKKAKVREKASLLMPSSSSPLPSTHFVGGELVR